MTATMRNTDLKRDFDAILTEVRLGNVDDTIGRIAIEAEKYILYLEAFEDRSRSFENTLDKMSESTDPNVKAVLDNYFKEFAIA